jgi:hypothetical protein
MNTSRREECIAKLAPEVRTFLERLAKVPAMPISAKHYKTLRQLMVTMVKKLERATFTGRITEARSRPRYPRRI